MDVRARKRLMVKLIALSCLCLSLKLSTSAALAQDNAFKNCRPAGGAARITSLAEVPREYRPVLKSIGEMVDVGQSFNSIDVSDASSPPERRFIGGFLSKNMMVIWYEHGGRGLHEHAIGYLVRRDTGGVKSHMTANIVSAPCAATVAIFAGIRTAQEHDI